MKYLPKETHEFLISLRKKSTTPEMSIDLTNLDDLSYQASIFIGSDKQALDVIYDTGSDFLVV